MTSLIFGCGYLGSRVAERRRQAGHVVRIVSRSSAKAAEFRAQGYEAVTADVTNPESLTSDAIWRDVKTVLFAVGFDRTSGKSIEEVYVGGVANVLRHCPRDARFVYVSSTGVYGASGGEWIDEDTPCKPQRDGGKACLAAENLLREDAVGPRTIILRLGGIYGPIRLPRIQDLIACRPITAAEDGWLNLIHVDDAARIVLDAADRSETPALFTVTDGRPVQRRDFYREAARLLGTPPPRFEEPSADLAPLTRGGSDKRVSNRRLVAALEPQFQFPSYREGLINILTSGRT